MGHFKIDAQPVCVSISLTSHPLLTSRPQDEPPGRGPGSGPRACPRATTSASPVSRASRTLQPRGSRDRRPRGRPRRRRDEMADPRRDRMRWRNARGSDDRMLQDALPTPRRSRRLTSIYFRLRFVMCMYAPLSLSRTRSKTRTTCTCTCTCTCICDAVSVTSTMQHATMYQHARGQRSHRPVVRASRRPQSRPDREVQRRVVGSPHPRRHLAQPRNQLRKGRTVDLCKRYGVCSAEVHTGLTLRLALN